MNENKVASFSTIVLLLLKELRLERNIHQAHIADACDKTPSAWNKIESGKNPLSMEVFFRVCQVFQISSSSLLATAERYRTLLSQHGWAIMSKNLDFNEDLLLIEANEYYSSAGYRGRIPNTLLSILNGPFYNPNGTVTISAVFQFVLDENFKRTQIDFKPIAYI